MIASLIWFLVNCSYSAVTSRLRLATLDDSCVSDRSVLLNDDSAYEIKLLSTNLCLKAVGYTVRAIMVLLTMLVLFLARWMSMRVGAT